MRIWYPNQIDQCGHLLILSQTDFSDYVWNLSLKLNESGMDRVLSIKMNNEFNKLAIKHILNA